MENNIPISGSLTFLFTEIDSGTRLAQEYREEYAVNLERHNEILREAVEANGGFVFKIINGAFCCSFHNAEDAINASVLAQLNLANEKWGEPVMNVRMGIHTGHAEWNGSDYMGYLTLARTNRIMSSANNEQILVSAEAVASISDSNEENTLINNRSGKNSFISLLKLGERRLKDLIEPVKLYQVTADGIRSDFPPVNTLDARPNNLPVQLTSFIGRKEILKHVTDDLEKSKLVTITGAGGTGKTRLALQAGAELIDRFSKGVWIVELASLTDEKQLFSEIMSSLKIEELPGSDKGERIVEYLKDKELLLILDNCEHLVEHCSEIAEELLTNCSNLRILATSREPLRCSGEKTIILDPLEHPGDDIKLSPSDLIKFDAVRLFTERALAVNTTFRITESNAEHVQKICNSLDGIPLAIELAAARINVMSPEMINKKLSDRFRLLTGGMRTSVPKQHTLKAMIDWSYDLLSEHEKILFGKLSVFMGGWTIEAAEKICSDKTIDESDILDLISGLNDKSLVTTKVSDAGNRFYMLETIRQYALSISPPGDDLRQVHLTYFRDVANQNLNRQSGLDLLQWLAIMDEEKENVRSAIEFSVQTNPEYACSIIRGGLRYWQAKGRLDQVKEFCKAIFASNRTLVDHDRALVLYALAVAECETGNIPGAELCADECYKLCTALKDKEMYAYSLNLMAVVLGNRFEFQKESAEKTMEAMEIFRELGNDIEYANMLYNLSFRLLSLGKKEESLNCRMSAIEILRREKEVHMLTLALTSVGTYYLNEGDPDKAMEFTSESLAISRECGLRFSEVTNYINLGSISIARKDFDCALNHLIKAAELSDEYGYISNEIAACFFLGEAYNGAGSFTEAETYYKSSLKMGIENNTDFFCMNNLCGLAYACLNSNRVEESARCIVVFELLRDFHELKIRRRSEYVYEDLRESIVEIIGVEQLERTSSELKPKEKHELLESLL